MNHTADVSECGLFRYSLTREWFPALPPLGFVMLNPSTADAIADDPTIRRCVGFARQYGYGGIRVVNLFAFRATDPRALAAAARPVGSRNDEAIERAAFEVIARNGHMVAAWGAHARGAAQPRADYVVELCERIAPLYCLRKLHDGVPAHPLMLPYSCTIQPFRGK